MKKIDSAAEYISFQMYFSLFVMAVAQVKMAINSPRDIAMLLEREEVMPSILKLREDFITKFLLAEFSTFPEDKLSGFHHRSKVCCCGQQKDV